MLKTGPSGFFTSFGRGVYIIISHTGQYDNVLDEIPKQNFSKTYLTYVGKTSTLKVLRNPKFRIPERNNNSRIALRIQYGLALMTSAERPAITCRREKEKVLGMLIEWFVFIAQTNPSHDIRKRLLSQNVSSFSAAVI